MKTINQFLKVLNDFATNHQQIGSYGQGVFSEVEANEAKKPSLMWVMITGSSRTGKTTRQVNMNILFMDLVLENQANLFEVQSDEELKAYDLITYLDSPTFEDDFRINVSSQLTPFVERFDNDWTGWMLSLSFETSYLRDECALPMN